MGQPPSSSPPLAPAVAGGGVLAHRWDADYLFSSDATHPDTRRWAVSPHPCHPHAGSTLLAWEMPAAPLLAHVEPSPHNVYRKPKIDEGVDNGFNVFNVNYLMGADILEKSGWCF